MRKVLTAILVLPVLLVAILMVGMGEVDPTTGKMVGRMSQAERKEYSERKAMAETLASDTRHAQMACALKLGIPYNEAWPVVATPRGYRVIYMTGKACEVPL